MRYYRLYANAAQANAANCQVIKSGRIKTVKWFARFDTNTDNASVDAELSLSPISTIAQNDSRGPVDAIAYANNLATNGSGVGQVNQQSFIDMPIAQGERLYLNTASSGTVALVVNAIIGVEE